jgi:hypothetical protein
MHQRGATIQGALFPVTFGTWHRIMGPGPMVRPAPKPALPCKSRIRTQQRPRLRPGVAPSVRRRLAMECRGGLDGVLFWVPDPMRLCGKAAVNGAPARWATTRISSSSAWRDGLGPVSGGRGAGRRSRRHERHDPDDGLSRADALQRPRAARPHARRVAGPQRHDAAAEHRRASRLS